MAANTTIAAPPWRMCMDRLLSLSILSAFVPGRKDRVISRRFVVRSRVPRDLVNEGQTLGAKTAERSFSDAFLALWWWWARPHPASSSHTGVQYRGDPFRTTTQKSADVQKNKGPPPLASTSSWTDRLLSVSFR